MRRAEPNAIPIEQLITDQHTRVQIPPYRAARFALQKKLRIDALCFSSGDSDGLLKLASILIAIPSLRLPHIPIHSDRIAHELGRSISARDRDDALPEQLIVHRKLPVIAFVPRVRRRQMQTQIPRKRRVHLPPKQCKASEKESVEERSVEQRCAPAAVEPMSQRNPRFFWNS